MKRIGKRIFSSTKRKVKVVKDSKDSAIVAKSALITHSDRMKLTRKNKQLKEKYDKLIEQVTQLYKLLYCYRRTLLSKQG